MFSNAYPQQPGYTSNQPILNENLGQLFTAIVTEYSNQRRIDPFQGTELLQRLKSCIPQLAARISSDPRYANGIHSDILKQIALETVANAVTGSGGLIQQQQPQQNFGAMFAPNNNFQTQPLQPLQSVLNPTPAPVVPPTKTTIPGRPIVVISASPERKYSVINDDEATTYSITKGHQSITDITAKFKLTDDLGAVYNYCSAESYIPEASLKQVITNFVETNPKLCVGKYIADIKYEHFVLKKETARQCLAIDLSPMLVADRSRLPIEVTIEAVLKSIGARDFSIVNCIEELLVREFNDLIMRYLRIDDDMNNILRIDRMIDIVQIATLRDKSFGNLPFHKDYEETVFMCFKEALLRIITDKTKIGYWDTMDILPHLMSSPSFVVRGPNVCEREYDPKDQTFTAAVASKYTAFANNGNVVVANFIPDELDTDLEGSIIQIKKITNSIDWLILNLWKRRSRTIIMTEANNQLVIKTGTTLDGTPFMFKSHIDMTEDLWI